MINSQRIEYTNVLFILLPVFACALVSSFEILDSSFLPRFIFLSFFLSISITWLLYIQWNKTGYVIPWKHPITIFLLLWLFASVISGINAINRAEYLAEVQKVFLYFTTFLVFATLIYKQNKMMQKYFLKAAVLVCFFLTAVGAYQFYIYDATINIKGMMRVTSLMSNKNLFSEYIALYFPFLIISVLTLKRFWKIIAISSTVFTLVFIVILLARSVWVALAASLVFILMLTIVWYSVKKIQFAGFTAKGYLLSFVVILSLIAAVWLADNTAGNPIKHRLISITETDKGSAGGRLQMWKMTIEMIKTAPLTGIGAGNWKLAFQERGLYQRGTAYQVEPLNDYIGIFAECGLFGFIAYTGILLTGIILLIKQIFFQQNKFPVFQAAALASVLIFSVISFFNFPKDRIEHVVFLCFLLTISSAEISFHTKNRQFISIPLLLILLTGLIYSGWSGCQRYSAEKHTRLALEARDRQHWNTVIKEINKAESPYYTLDPTTTPLAWYKGIAYYTLGKTDSAFINFQAAYKANPFHTHVLNNLATCFELKGNHEQAIKLYREAIRINPSFIDALLNITAVLYNLGQYEQALLILEQSPVKNKGKIIDRIKFLRKAIKLRTNKNRQY